MIEQNGAINKIKDLAVLYAWVDGLPTPSITTIRAIYSNTTGEYTNTQKMYIPIVQTINSILKQNKEIDLNELRVQYARGLVLGCNYSIPQLANYLEHQKGCEDYTRTKLYNVYNGCGRMSYVVLMALSKACGIEEPEKAFAEYCISKIESVA